MLMKVVSRLWSFRCFIALRTQMYILTLPAIELTATSPLWEMNTWNKSKMSTVTITTTLLEFHKYNTWEI